MNEIQKSVAFNTCNKARTAFAATGPISGWVGRIEAISTNQGADVVSLRIATSVDGFDIGYRTVSNRVSDIGSGSLITPDNPLFSALAGMQEGEVVEFDGEFLQDPSGDQGVWESSFTEEGSMEEPGFNLRFTAIRRPGAIKTASAGNEIHAVQSTVTLPTTPSTGAAQNSTMQSEEIAFNRQPYGRTRSQLLGLGYQPEAETSESFPQSVDGDPAMCGNAGCQIPWTRGTQSVCVGVTVNDNLEESSWSSKAEPGSCT
ncbi:hypothetical protein ACX94F_08645 [Stenotrophomonas hibiscicola]